MKTRREVRNISINSPCAIDVSGASVVKTAEIFQGNMTETSALAQIAPINCEGLRKRLRIQGSWPAMQRPNVTCDFVSIAAPKNSGYTHGRIE
jgi:hypothetical protein